MDSPNPNKDSSSDGNLNDQKKIDYLKIIKQAFALTIKHKFLWIFGIFTALTSGGGGSFGGGGNFDEIGKELNDKHELENIYASVVEFCWTNITLLIILGIILLLIIITLFVMGIVSRGALINGIHKTSLGLSSNFKSALKSGLGNFWRLLGVQLFGVGIITLTLIILALPIIFLIILKNPLVILLAFIGVIFLLFIAFCTAFIVRLANLFVVCLNQKTTSAISSGYNFLIKNFGILIILWLINITLGFVFGIGAIILLILFVIIGSMIAGIFYVILKTAGAVIVGAILLSLLTISMLFIQGVFTVFTNSIWVIFFNETAGQKIKSDDKKAEAKDLAEVTA